MYHVEKPRPFISPLTLYEFVKGNLIPWVAQNII